jgi:hypothetical protein
MKSKALRRLHERDLTELALEELADINPAAVPARMQKLEA